MLIVEIRAMTKEMDTDMTVSIIIAKEELLQRDEKSAD